MKIVLNTFMGLLILFQSCTGQNSPEQEIFNEDFNWTITIPENFENVKPLEWARLQNKGLEAIEDTYDEEIINQAKTIFVFKSDQFNYFESNYQPFDVEVDGDYIESCKNVNEILYNTFKTQMPGIEIDTVASTESVDNLEFQKFEMVVKYPNDVILNVFMFSRLFDKKEFTVNIMYVDERKGKSMLASWRKSKFIKE